MRALLLVASLAGCDAVLGLDDDPGPCGTGSFADASTHDVAQAWTFSMTRDASLIVLVNAGVPFQIRAGGDPEPIDLGAYLPASFSLAPDGSSLFYTASIEPPQLLGAYRAGDGWQLSATVPRATYVGTPSAGEYGPRRMLARETMTSADLQEYEDVDGVWTPHGDPLPSPGAFAPNLTPTGLTMVFATSEGIWLASRDALDAAFAAPTLVLPGEHGAPQLLDNCHTLYTVDTEMGGYASTLRSYRR